MMIRAMAVVCAAGAASIASAQFTTSLEAYNNATVQPAGPRSGANGKAFYNVQGANNGDFASYGVARWDNTSLVNAFDNEFGQGNWWIDSIYLEVTQSNAGFTNDGPVQVWFGGGDNADTIGIEPGDGINFNDGGAPFGPVSILSYNFVEQNNGFVESHLLYERGVFEPQGGLALAADIELGDLIATLVMTPENPATSATYAGYTNNTYPGPTLVVTASLIPAPGAAALLALGGLTAARRRR